MAPTKPKLLSDEVTFTHLRRWAWLLLAFAAFVAILIVPLPAVRSGNGGLISLPGAGRTSLALTALSLVLWVSEAVPFAVTGLAILLLFPALGVATQAEVAGNGLGHPVILFFLSLFLLSAAFVHVGLSQRVSNYVLHLSGGRASRLILLTLAVGALLAMGISALAATAALLGMAKQILGQTRLGAGRSNFARALLIATSWGPLIGSVGTPAGAGSNPLTIGYLKELAGVEVTFARWMLLGVPAMLLLVPLAWLVLCWAFRAEQEILLSADDLAQARANNQAPLTRPEKLFLAVFGVTLALWVFGPVIGQWTDGRFAPPLESVGLAAALVLFLPGLDLLPWPIAQREVHWGTLLVLGGGMAAGVMLYRTGAARWLAWTLLGPLGSVAAAPRVFAILAAICVMRLAFSSSTAAAAVLVPMAIALAQDLKVDPWLFTAPVAFAANLAFILPTQAAVHLVSYSAGRFSSRDMIKGGVFLTVLAIVVVGSVVLVVGNLTAIYRF